jgi:hypothetical protein
VPAGMSFGYLSIMCIRKTCRILTTLRTDSPMDILEQLELQEDQLIGNKRLVKSSILDYYSRQIRGVLTITTRAHHRVSYCTACARACCSGRGSSIIGTGRQRTDCKSCAKTSYARLRRTENAYLHKRSRGRKQRCKGPAQ